MNTIDTDVVEYVRDRKAVAGDVMRLADRLTRLATNDFGRCA
jgi:hypothetical protein